MGNSQTDSVEDTRLTAKQFNSKKLIIKMPKGSGLTKPMKLSADLADIVGKKEASRAECIKLLWAYLKKNNLQDPENKQFFTPDKKMAKVFGNDRIRAFGMAKFPLRTLVLSVLNCQSTHSWLDKPILRWLAHLRIRKEISAQFSTQPRQRCLATLKYLIHPCL